MGGAADLAPVDEDDAHVRRRRGASSPASRGGRNLHFGIREHASAAIANGMALTKVRPYWSGFLIFSDYARGAIRLSALMEIPVIHIFTHDSIGVGEDGPTHQPVEQLASLRAMPGLLVFRPADANEVVETWRVVAPLRHEPAVAIILSRQALPTFDRSSMGSADGVAKGAYVLVDAERRRAGRACCWPPGPRCSSRWPLGRSCRPRASGRGWSACRAGSCSTASRAPTGTRCSRRR